VEILIEKPGDISSLMLPKAAIHGDPSINARVLFFYHQTQGCNNREVFSK
jgi:hypothetical protein